MHRVSQASAQNPISCFGASTMTRRSGCQAGWEPGPRWAPAMDWLWLNEPYGLCSRFLQVQSCCRAPLVSQPGKQSAGNMSCVPRTMVPGTHCVSQDDRAVLSYSWLKCHISFGEQLQYRPLTDRSGFKSWLWCLLKLLFWTTSLTSLCFNFPIYNRDVRVSTSRAPWSFWWSNYKALCLVHSNVVSYHCCNYLPETRWLKTIAMYHLTACTNHKSKHSQVPWVLSWGSHKAKIKVLAAMSSYLEALGQNSLPSPFRGLEEFRSLCDCRSEVSISWGPLYF